MTEKVKIEYVSVEKLRGWDSNPRVMTEQQHQALRISIKEFGLVEPVIINKNNMIIGGHQRVINAQKLNLKEVPCIRVDLPPRKWKALNLALNKIHGDWDLPKLEKIIGELKDLPEIKFTGFTREEIDAIIRDSKFEALHFETTETEAPILMLGPYFAGKTRLVRIIASCIPPHRCYVEPFGGFCSILLNKPQSKVEVYNDISSDIVNLMLCVRDHPQEIFNEIALLPYSRELYEKYITMFSEKTSIPDIPRAAKWFYMNQSTFAGIHGVPSPGNWGHSSKRNQAQHLRNSSSRIFIIAQRLLSVMIENRDFTWVIDHYDSPDTFFFVDPPYLETDVALGIHFSFEQHKDLRDRLSKVKGKWLQTINSHPSIIDLYKAFETHKVTVRSTAAGAEGFECDRTITRVIITNYPIREIPSEIENEQVNEETEDNA